MWLISCEEPYANTVKILTLIPEDRRKNFDASEISVRAAARKSQIMELASKKKQRTEKKKEKSTKYV